MFELHTLGLHAGCSLLGEGKIISVKASRQKKGRKSHENNVVDSINKIIKIVTDSILIAMGNPIFGNWERIWCDSVRGRYVLIESLQQAFPKPCSRRCLCSVRNINVEIAWAIP